MPSFRDLKPHLRESAEDLLKQAREIAIDAGLTPPRITSVLRSRVEQERLYNKFLAGESELPAAKPGTSKHEKGLAFDLATPDTDPWDDELLPVLGAMWNEAGGTWRASDPVHFEGPEAEEEEPTGWRRWLPHEPTPTEQVKLEEARQVGGARLQKLIDWIF
jgi:hypothetical protein